VVYELLTPDNQGAIEFCMMIIPPHASSNTQAKSHTGEEVAFMHSGSCVELEMESSRYVLHPGDSIRIPPDARHCWHNPGEETVQVIFAVTPPSF